MTVLSHTHTHTHTRLTALCPGLPRWAVTRKLKPIWILLKQETVSGSGISWAVCKSAPRSRQITTPAPHHSVFYRPDALPATQPTASKHWRLSRCYNMLSIGVHAGAGQEKSRRKLQRFWCGKAASSTISALCLKRTVNGSLSDRSLQ